MIITLIGQTDKRPVLYTFLRMCEHLGDCAVVTNDRRLMRLMQEGPGPAGSYRNIDIFVTDAMADEVWTAIDHAPYDYDYTFLDNLYVEETDLVIYVKGMGVDEVDQASLDAFEAGEYITVKMGKPDKPPKKPKQVGHGRTAAQSKENQPKVYNIPYEARLMEKLEFCEFYRELVAVSNPAVKVCAEILAPLVKTTAKNLEQVGLHRGSKGANSLK